MDDLRVLVDQHSQEGEPRAAIEARLTGRQRGRATSSGRLATINRTWSDGAGPPAEYDLICLSHLRWDFVYQRPQHLLSRSARERRVFLVEEPKIGPGPARLEVTTGDGVQVVVPWLPDGLTETVATAAQRELLDHLVAEQAIQNYVLWYYTPMALPFTSHLEPRATVYDCMDELSAFAGAAPALREREAELFNRADLVFTGGYSLYEAKRHQHPRVYPFPSSVDTAHFGRARAGLAEALDQASIPHPRLGFYGVIDERLDRELLHGVAAARPDWHLVMVGPVVKIDPESLPQAANIHYLGGKQYGELPTYLAGWDVALLPFARNESTRFISPTKIPEYLAAGRPVVSTPIRDIVRPYGDLGLVRIGETKDEFVAAVAAALEERAAARLERVDRFLAGTSWDRTWTQMRGLIDEVVLARRANVLPMAAASLAV